MNELFERIKTEGVSVIDELIATGAQEGLQLDFKASNGESGNPLFKDNGKTLSKEGRKVIAKELSSFANSAGGVIIIGVVCKQDSETKVDGASEASHLDHLDACVSAMNQAIGSLVQPVVHEIEILPIETAKGSNKGFLVVHIPRSNRRPHRSEATDQKQYYKRSGASSFAMEHYDIEDAFRRISSPVMSISTFGVAKGNFNTSNWWLCLHIFVHNMGSSTAKRVAFKITDREEWRIEMMNTETTVNKVGSSGRIYLPENFSINPGDSKKCFQLNAIYIPQGKVFQLAGHKVSDFSEIDISIDLFAEDMLPVRFQINYSTTEIEEYAMAHSDSRRDEYEFGSREATRTNVI